jgi:hypothetical protein
LFVTPVIILYFLKTYSFFSSRCISQSAQRQRLAFATHYVRQETWLFRQDVQETVPAI